MRRVRGKDTKPEIAVRRVAHALGYRFRLHRRDLPGSPDIVFPKLRKAIFVHGCYWHRHDCKKATVPKSNVSFWQNKFEANIERDRRNLVSLSEMGWLTMIVWQCETEKEENIAEMISNFLGSTQ